MLVDFDLKRRRGNILNIVEYKMSEKCDETGTNHRGMRNVIVMTRKMMLMLRNMMLMMRNMMLIMRNMMLMPRSMMVKYQSAASSPTILPAGSRELVRAACQVKCF